MIKNEIGKVIPITGREVSPRLYCDVCNKEITDKNFNVLCDANKAKEGELKDVIFVHKGDCDYKYEKDVKFLPWMEGRDFFNLLLNNIFCDFKKGNLRRYNND